MNIFTHALAPVVITKIAFGHRPWVGKYGFWAIGLAGAMPDILNPHITLESRLSSWSHGLPFWAALTAGLFIISCLCRTRIPPKLAAILSFAYFFHLFCDSISGGVNWLFPFGKFIWGNYLVDPIYWIPLDVIFFLATYYLFRLAPLIQARKRRGSPHVASE